MKNKLTDLQNHLFELMERLNDDELTHEELDTEVKRSEAFSSLAIIAVKNAALIAKLAEDYGLPVSGDLPLLPASPKIIAEKDDKEEPVLSRKGTLLKMIEEKEGE